MLLDESALDGKGDILLLNDKQDSNIANHPAPAPAPAPAHGAPAPAAPTELKAKAEEASAEKKEDEEAKKEGDKASAEKKEGSPEGEKKEGSDPMAEAEDHEVIIDMEILPGERSSSTSAAEIYEKLEKTLQDPQSLLRTGPLGGILAKGELSLGKKPTPKDANDQKAHKAHAMDIVPNSILLLLLTSLRYGLV